MLILTSLILHAALAPNYTVIHKYPIPGEGGWDYITVDPDSNRLYISRGTHVQVMATDTGKIVGDIPNTPGVHGIALAKSLGKGFTSNGRDNSVSVFELKTLKETSRVKVGMNPDGIIYDSFSGYVFTFNGRSSDATAFDAKSGKVMGTVPLGGKPEGGVSDGKGTIFVNVEDKSSVVEFGAKSLKVIKSFALAPGEEPTGIGFDAKKGLIFSGCGNSMLTVLDVKSGKIIGSAPTGGGTDFAGYDPSTGTAFTSNGEGTLSVIQLVSGKYKNVQNVKTQPSARTMSLDAKHHLVYLIAAEFEAAPAGGRRGAMKPGSAAILVVGMK